jgi:cysteine synthase A
MIFGTVSATVGRTPLVELKKLGAGLRARLVGKLESRNPCGSVKDRIAVAMIEDAERSGKLQPGATLVEATSGNTGIALAFAAAAKGYKLILTMPERISREHVLVLRYLGAQVVLTPGSLMKDAVQKARALAGEIAGAMELRQFENPANPEAHRRGTAVEIWDDTAGAIDWFVAGVGTGGTITGVGQVLKAKKPGVRIVAVEPERAAVLSGQQPRNHIMPPLLDRSVIDEVATVGDNESLAMMRRLAREEGISAGISSGATLAAALKLAARPEADGKLIVVLIADAGDRYLSTALGEELLES